MLCWSEVSVKQACSKPGVSVSLRQTTSLLWTKWISHYQTAECELWRRFGTI